MQGRSTCQQLLNVINDLKKARESNTNVDITYLDLIEKFNTVPHYRSLYGRIISFLSNWQQCAMINGC